MQVSNSKFSSFHNAIQPSFHFSKPSQSVLSQNLFYKICTNQSFGNLRCFSNTNSNRLFSLNPSSFKPFVRVNAVSESQLQLDAFLTTRRFEEKIELEDGILYIRPLTSSYLSDAVNLLVDSFMEINSFMSFKTLLAIQVQVYLQQRLLLAPYTVILISSFFPKEVKEDSYLPDVISTVDISLNLKSRPRFWFLNPDSQSAFISNMAVDKNFRRMGYARATLRAAEKLIFEAGLKCVELHCRIIDEAPLNLYTDEGYETVGVDPFFLPVLFQKRKYLLKKNLTSGEST